MVFASAEIVSQLLLKPFHLRCIDLKSGHQWPIPGSNGSTDANCVICVAGHMTDSFISRVLYLRRVD